MDWNEKEMGEALYLKNINAPILPLFPFDIMKCSPLSD
jgi:hypothetical protein